VLDPATGQCDPFGRDQPRRTARFFQPLLWIPSPSSASHREAGSKGAVARVCCWRMAIWSWPTGSTSTGWWLFTGRLTIAGAGPRVTGLVLLRHGPSDTARLTGAGSIALSRCAIGARRVEASPFGPFRAEAGVGSKSGNFQDTEWLPGGLRMVEHVSVCFEITVGSEGGLASGLLSRCDRILRASAATADCYLHASRRGVYESQRLLRSSSC
jgi:hypothetical protein